MKPKIHTNLFLICVAMMSILWLGGCVDVKIKTDIPPIQYYSFHYHTLTTNSKDSTKQCLNPTRIKLKLEVSQAFNTNAILALDTQDKVQKLPNVSWIDLPSNLFAQALESSAQKECIYFERVGNIDKRVRVWVEYFGIREKFASVVLSYTIYKGDIPIQTTQIKTHTAYTTKDEQIQALQHSANDAIAEVIQQTKASLESSALQSSTKDK